MVRDLLRTQLRHDIEHAAARRKLDWYYPDTGPLRRELYAKHLKFFRGGIEHRERLFMAANRVGKTEGVGGYETTLHLTGQYPHWWEGRRFDRPISACVAGKTSKTTRDIVQTKLFGEVEGSGPTKRFSGTGLVPGDAIADIGWGTGFPDLSDRLKIKHKSGGLSQVVLKTYEQGRGAFEGTEQDVVWLDEEPPLDVYIECLVRTMTTDGLVMITFTPLEGMSETVLTFLVNGRLPEDT